MKEKTRCAWAGTDPVYIRYHDEEWGVPIHDDRKLFEFLILEGAQAGLSWITILKRREGYRKAFADFDAKRVARFDGRKIERLLLDPGIIRNRQKVESAVTNARAFLAVQKEFGTFDTYIWSFQDGKVIHGRRRAMSDIPPKTPLSETISKALVKRGFRFVGPTIIYAHMQATGMVNDHVASCFRRGEVAGLQDRVVQERLDRLLLEGLESGEPIEVTPEFWARKKEDLVARAGKLKRKKKTGTT